MTATIFDLGAVPVIVPDLPEVDYHASPALSSTGARTLLRNAAKFDYDRTHPAEPKDAFDLGSAVHTEVLGKGWPVQVFDYANWKTKAAQEDQRRCRAEGVIPLLRKEYDVVRAMAASVLSDRRAKRIFETPQLREASAFATDPDTGVDMRARFDVLAPDAELMADLKTADSAADVDFAKAAARYGYQVQEWWYRLTAGLATRLNHPMPGDFRFVVVEKSPPYLVNVIELDAEFAQIGRSQVDRALRTFAECEASGVWRGYDDGSDEPNLVGPPGWLSYSEGMEL